MSRIEDGFGLRRSLLIRDYEREIYDKAETPIERELYFHLSRHINKHTTVKAQEELVMNDHISFYPDFMLVNDYFDKKIIIECDGKDYHTKVDQQYDDRVRDAMILSANKADCIFRFSGYCIYTSVYDCFYSIQERFPGCFLLTNFPKSFNPACEPDWDTVKREYPLKEAEFYVRLRDENICRGAEWLACEGLQFKLDVKYILEESKSPFNKAIREFLEERRKKKYV